MICESFLVFRKNFLWKTGGIPHLVFHNMWKENRAFCEQKSKKVRKYKEFFK